MGNSADKTSDSVHDSNNTSQISEKKTTKKAKTNEVANKHIHQSDITTNQISYQTFKDYINRYFAEIDEQKYERITKQTELDSEFLNNKIHEFLEVAYQKKEISIFDRLINSLVHRDFPLTDIPEYEDDFSLDLSDDSTEETEIICNIQPQEIYKSEELINKEKTLKNAIKNIELLKQQVLINNARKEIIKDILKKKLAYQGFLSLKKQLYDKFEKLYNRAHKSKKRRLGELETTQLNGLAEKINTFNEKFHRFDEHILEYFNVNDNFHVPNVNIEKKNFTVPDLFK
ncbi:hypothetical protein TCON_0147 [Astathelohania contejeani]|uniref:Uncharacterized protein n=1 Tax=Astathelohania contejeani TaxID=164912 RepID=A0ABQ7I2K4_9MICR|nr:hypothetical protein TCON_0147 [Thelohania contejeani]